MKMPLLALALFAFVGSSAFAQGSPDKSAPKVAKKESCAKGMAGGSCCMKGGKTAAAKPAPKAPAVTAKM